MARKLVRTATVAVALILVLAAAGAFVQAAGFGTFVVGLFGGAAQQGQVTITGACQAGDPVTVTLVNGFDEGSGQFVITDLSFEGINPACENGTLVINGDSADTHNFVVANPEAGIDIPLVPAPPVGGIGSLALMLNVNQP